MNPTSFVPSHTETTRKEYGLKDAHGGYRWPDGDDELLISGVYYAATGYAADVRKDLLAAVARENDGRGALPLALVEREVMTRTSEPVVVTPSFPTEQGAIVEATYVCFTARSETRRFVLTSMGDETPLYARLNGGKNEGPFVLDETSLKLKRVLSEKGPQ